jgi:hypothetical protein
VSAVDDRVDSGVTSSVFVAAHSVTSADVDFSGLLSQTVTVTVVEDDKAALLLSLLGADVSTGAVAELRVSLLSLTLREGSSGVYGVCLGSQPRGAVRVVLSLNATAPPPVEVRLPASGWLTFTALDWWLPQVVELVAVEDSVARGSVSAMVLHSISAPMDVVYSDSAVTEGVMVITTVSSLWRQECHAVGWCVLASPCALTALVLSRCKTMMLLG